MIFKYRYCIVDLHQRLLELHQTQYATKSLIKFTAYRGQLMSVDELEKLKTNVGGFFCVNSFLSASCKSDVAARFATDVLYPSFYQRVLYEINIDGQGPWRWPFADIHAASCNTDEREILFGTGSTFRIDDVSEMATNLWLVNLTLLDMNDPSVGINTKLYDYLLTESFRRYEQKLLILCAFLQQMGEFERAKSFCNLLLRDLVEGQALIDIHIALASIEFDLGNFHKSKNILEEVLSMQIALEMQGTEKHGLRIISNIYSHLGLTLSALGDYKEAIGHYRQAVSILRDLPDDVDEDLAIIYLNLGMAYSDLGNLRKALYWLEKRALRLFLLKLPPNHPRLADAYCNIAEIYCENGKYDKARKNYELAVEIEKISLPPLHPSTHSTLNNLGVLCQKIGDYDAALAFDQQALEVLLHSCPLDHASFASIYNNMAVVFDCQGDFDSALSYYNKALEYLMNSFAAQSHPHIASAYHNIGMVYFQKEQYNTALEYFTRAQHIEEELLERNHQSLATTYNNIGRTYAAERKLDEAMEYHQRALKMQRRLLSKNHPDLATSYDNIGVVYNKRGRYKLAMNYHRRALTIQKKSLPKNHPSVASTKEHMGDVYFHLGNLSAALKYYQSALAMAQKCIPASHPSINTYKEKIDQVQKACGNK